ncbi:MAG: protein kinase domain-containing protein [Acidobacteriota bacterium]
MEERTVGRFRIVRPIGSGGMGAVYEGFDDQLRRRVAIKGLLAQHATPERRERLRREALAVAALSHPSIAHVYEIASDGDEDFVVMEFVEGRSLAEALTAGPLQPGEAARIGGEIALALAEAHRHGIIHRDIKPENVMLTPSGHVKVLDFGLAKRTGAGACGDDSLTSDGVVVGTSKAMSPEQALGRPLDHRSDIFSLGSLLYETVVGTPAFSGTTPMETMVMVSRAEHQPVGRIAPTVPAELCEIIERCLARRREERFQSAAEVAAALLPLSQRSALTRTLPAAGHLTALVRAARRHWHGLAAGAVVTAALVAGATWFGWLASPPLLTVGVLPVATQSASVSTGLASQAVLDAITTRLAHLDGIAMVSGRDVAAVATPDRRSVEIATDLGVKELVQASMTQSKPGSPARISLARIDGATGRVTWSRELEVGTDDLLLLEDRITTALEDAYRGFRTSGTAATREINAEALKSYLEAVARLDGGGVSRGLEEERALLTRAIAAAPRFVDALLALVRIERYLYTTSHDAIHRSRCEELLERARELAPHDPRVAIAEVRFLTSIGAHERAVGAAKALTRERPGDPAAWDVLGIALGDAGRHDEAKRALRRAISLQPWQIYYFDLAKERLDAGDAAAARDALQVVLKRSPQDVFALSKLGQIELQVGNYAGAEPIYRRLVEEFGSGIDLANLGTALFYQHKMKDAISVYQRATAADPEDPISRCNLGDAYLWSGDERAARQHYAQALAMCDRLLGAGQDDPTITETRAICLAHLGRGPEAILAAGAVLREQPDDPYALFVAALVASVAGDESSALAWTGRALERGAVPVWFSGPEFAAMRGKPAFAALFAGREATPR